MNKKKFLKILEEKLQILSEEERTDIINEYKDTIEEKVRHGSKEEEAVADFGSIEELAREILKAYKINPDYKKEETGKAKDILEEGEDLIKKGAKRLSDWTQEIISDFNSNEQNWTLEKVFEVIIKIIILLIGLSLLRIPFYWIEYLGLGIFEMTFSPFTSIFKIIVRSISGLIYLGVCVIIALIVFRPYFTPENKNSKKKINKTNVPSDNQTRPSVEKQSTGAGRVFFEICKAFIFLCTVFPLYLIDFGCYIAVMVLIFLLIEGFPIIGPLFLMLSVSIFFTFLTNVIYQLLYGKKRVYCYSLIVSAIFLVTGLFFTLHTISDIEVYHGLPNHSFTQKEVTYHEIITNEYLKISYWDYQIEIDDMLEDNEVDIIVSYYPDFVTELKNDKTEYQNTTFLKLKTDYRSVKKSTRKNLYRMIKKELKNLNWYDYWELGELNVTVKVNHNTVHKIKK